MDCTAAVVRRCPRAAADDSEGSRGSALLPVMLLMFLFSAVAIGAAVVARVETVVAARFRSAATALYAADAGLAAALAELRTIVDWTPVLRGAIRSSASQGAFSGSKHVDGGGAVMLCCAAGSLYDRLSRENAASPVPARRALPWQPFLWSTFDALAPQVPPTRLLVAVFVQDDEEDGDGDGGADANGVVVVRAEAVDPLGLRRSVEAVVERKVTGSSQGGAAALAVLVWREVR